MSRFSLFDDLTQTSGDYAVTELSKLLIKTIGYDVCSAKRNTHSLYSLVSRARDVCNVINDLISKVDTDDSWAIFDQCTGMILPLEDILFRLSVIAEKEALVQDAETIQSCLDSIETWKENRKEIRNTMQHLYAGTFKLDPASNESEPRAIYKHDDNALFFALCQGTRSHNFKSYSPSIGPLLEKIPTQLEKIQGKVVTISEASDDIVVMGVQSAMLMNGLMELLNKPSDAGLAKRLRSSEIWQKALNLLSVIDKHANNLSQPFADVEKEWSDFLAFLTTSGVMVELPSTFMAMRSLISSIRRPYYAQSLALVRACIALEPHFSKNKVPDVLKPFATAIEDTTKALTAAGKLPSPYSAGAVFQPANNPDVSSAFGAAEQSLKACFESYQLDSWSSYKGKIEDARKTDQSHLNKLGERLRKTPTSNPKKSESLISLTVNIRNMARGASKHSSIIYAVEPSTILNAVLWKEASRFPDLRIRMQAAYFEHAQKKLSLNTEVGKITESAGQRVVTLVLPA